MLERAFIDVDGGSLSDKALLFIKLRNHSKTCGGPKASSPDAIFNNSKVPLAVLLKENIDAATVN